MSSGGWSSARMAGNELLIGCMTPEGQAMAGLGVVSGRVAGTEREGEGGQTALKRVAERGRGGGEIIERLGSGSGRAANWSMLHLSSMGHHHHHHCRRVSSLFVRTSFI